MSVEKVPWIYRLVDEVSQLNKRINLPKGEAPPKRLNIGPKGYILRNVGIENMVGVATYEMIMEVV